MKISTKRKQEKKRGRYKKNVKGEKSNPIERKKW